MPWDVVPILKLVVKNDKNYMKNLKKKTTLDESRNKPY